MNVKVRFAAVKFRWGAIAGLQLCVAMLSLQPAWAQPLAQGQRKFVGNVISNGFSIRSDFPNYWNQVTAENAGKWGNVESSPGVYNWTELDNIYNYAVSLGFRYRHHTLIWGSQQPSFMTSLDSAAQYTRIDSWIRESGLRYLSASFVDAVNEPLHQPPAYRNALGGNGATGWDWLIRSFQLARQHWPFTKLHLNDYGIINDGNATTQYLQLITLLQTRGLIDGIAVQCHRFEIENAASTTLRSNLDRLAATGLPIYITEFDLGNLGNSGTANDSVQLALYQQKFPIIWEHPGVQGITLWGYVQGFTWQSTAYLLRSDGTERPALQWLRTYLRLPIPPATISPNGGTGVPRNALLVWRSSALATSYRVQVSTTSTFSTLVVDSTVTDTVHRTTPLGAATLFYWRVRGANTTGNGSFSSTGSFTTGNEIVGVAEANPKQVSFGLQQNYPNPFNPTTHIKYSLAERSYASLRVYDVLGKEVATLFEGLCEAGDHTATLSAGSLSSGVYLYTFTAGRFTQTKRLLLLR